MKRRVIPGAEGFSEMMLMRILVNVYDQSHEIGCALDRDSLEGTLE